MSPPVREPQSALAAVTISPALSLLTNNGRQGAAVPVSLLISRLNDSSQPLKSRRQAAWQLAKLESDEALASLRQALLDPDASGWLKATIAEALGNSAHPGAKALLYSLARSEGEVAAGAIRGLGASADARAAEVLSEILKDPKRKSDTRVEAALSLGRIDTPAAYRSLVEIASAGGDEEIAKAALLALGRRSFDETESFFRSYLTDESLDTELRVAALEGLGAATGDPSKFLIGFLSDHNPEIRAAAAWAIASLDSPADVGNELIAQLLREPRADVRARIYQALENQQTADVDVLFRTVLNDAHTASRLAGFKYLAGHPGIRASPDLTAQFDRLIVPELQRLALAGADLNVRLGSVVALREAKTRAAIGALQLIALESHDPGVVKAAIVGATH